MKQEDPESSKVDDELPDMLGRGYFLLRCCGLHPHRLVNLRLPTLVFLCALYVAPYVIPAIFSIHEAMTIDSNMMDLMENIQLPAGYTQVTGKLLTAFFQRHNLLFLINNEHKFWNLQNINDLGLRNEIKRMCNNCLNIQAGLISMVALSMVASDLTPFLSDKPLPVGTAKGVDSELLVRAIFVIDEVGLLFCIMPVGGFDSVFTGACFKITVQFKILGDTLRNIDFKGDRARIVEVMEHHKFLLEYTKTFKKAVQFMVLTQLLSSFVILGQHMYAFNASQDVDFGVVGRFFLVLGQCAFFCIIAQLLSSEAESMAGSIYHSSWYENPSSDDQAVVLMVMARSLKAPKLSAYGMIDLNMNTLGKILKATFSMYSLLSNTK